MPFEDRREAGRRLAAALGAYRDQDPVVLALPRGGVPVAYEVARALDAPLDVVVARKIGAPGNPEFGVGAVAPPSVRVLDEGTLSRLGITHAELDQTIVDETMEMERRLLAYRGDRRLPDVAGRTVILVDDGLATGVTTRAAVRALRDQEPRRLVLAVPVGPPDTVDSLRDEVDELVCLETPEDFRAVGLWYRVFDQTSDEEVMELLERARRERAVDAGGA